MMAILPAIQSLMNERVEVVSMSMPNIMMIGPANAVENRRLIRCLGSSLTSFAASLLNDLSFYTVGFAKYVGLTATSLLDNLLGLSLGIIEVLFGLLSIFHTLVD